MTPARDRFARLLMIGLGIASVGAFANAAFEFQTVAPDRINIEAWRMLAFLVFAGLFTLLGFFPRRLTGVWELVIFHKAGVAIFLTYFVPPQAGATFADTTGTIVLVDATLGGISFFCYLLTEGWRAWSPQR